MILRITLPRKTIWAGLAVSLALVLCLTSRTLTHGQSAQPKDKPFVVEYYYKAKWGYADEFIRLFKKNHYPFLKKQIEVGNALQVTAQSPINHSTEDGRWDYRITIVWKNVQVAHDDTGDDQVLKQLYPDQETFKREEQRRFEILVGHWDVPIKSVDLDQK
jgi:hypothetical protein